MLRNSRKIAPVITDLWHLISSTRRAESNRELTQLLLVYENAVLRAQMGSVTSLLLSHNSLHVMKHMKKVNYNIQIGINMIMPAIITSDIRVGNPPMWCSRESYDSPTLISRPVFSEMFTTKSKTWIWVVEMFDNFASPQLLFNSHLNKYITNWIETQLYNIWYTCVN